MGEEIKLNQWYLKMTEYPDEDLCLSKTTDLFYAKEYHPQYHMYSGYFVSFMEFGSIENCEKDCKKSTETVFDDDKALPTTSLIEYGPISYKEAGEYIGGFTVKYFNLCN